MTKRLRSFFSFSGLSCPVCVSPASLGGLLGAALAVITPTIALAATEHAEHHSASVSEDLTWFWLNFTIYWVGLYLIVRGPAIRGWATRQAALAAEVQRQAQELSASKEKRADAERKLSEITQEVAVLRSTISQETERERQLIVAEAQRRAERIAKQATDTLRAEHQAGESLIQRQIAEMVVQRAAESLKASLTEAGHQSLRLRAIQGIGKLTRTSGSNAAR